VVQTRKSHFRSATEQSNISHAPINFSREDETAAKWQFSPRAARAAPLGPTRRPVEAEVEFMTLMRFASWDAVKAFAGPDWEVSVVPPAARAVLARFDEKARHYEQRVG
jgi:hypothetical protein